MYPTKSLKNARTHKIKESTGKIVKKSDDAYILPIMVLDSNIFKAHHNLALIQVQERSQITCDNQSELIPNFLSVTLRL